MNKKTFLECTDVKGSRESIFRQYYNLFNSIENKSIKYSREAINGVMETKAISANKNDPAERDRSKCFHNGIILIVIRFNLTLSYT
jgi:hypothetical protein